MWTYNYTDELYHYGVLGMKWGVRKQYQPVGGSAHSFKTNSAIYGHRGAMRIDKRMAKGMSAKSAKRRETIRSVAKVAGIALAGAGAVHLATSPAARTAAIRNSGKVLAYMKGMKFNSAGAKRAMSSGKNYMSKLAYKGIYKGKMGIRYARNSTRQLGLMAKRNPAGRAVNNVIKTPKRILSQTNAGKALVKGYMGAALVSDANTTQQWVRKVKKQGKVTKKDVKNLAVDYINPLPDNIPYINKNARAKRRANKKKGN